MKYVDIDKYSQLEIQRQEGINLTASILALGNWHMLARQAASWSGLYDMQ